MKALFRLMALGRAQAGWLLFGLAMSLISTLIAVSLSGAAGAVFAGGILVAAPMALRALGPLRVVSRYAERMVTHNALFRALADLRVWFFRRIAARMAGGLGMARAGDLLARLVGDVEAQDAVYMRVMLPLVGALALLPILAVVLGNLDIWLALAVCVLFVVSAFVLPMMAMRGALAGGTTLAQAMAGVRVATLDAVTGLREVRAFAAEGRMLAATQARESTLLTAQSQALRRVSWAGAAAFLSAQAAILATLLLGRDHGATAIALVFLVMAAFEAVALLPRAGAQAGVAAAAAERVVAMTDSPIPCPDQPKPAPLPASYALRIEAVGFRWQEDRPPVFDGLSLDIPQGAHVALLGPSGIGKSTLAALCLRLESPQIGRITLGGVDIASLAAADLRHQIGWLSQATHLFDDTIRANLLIARPEASDAELWNALERAQIADAVRALPDGIETYLGEGGLRFSGGQGRRLALARILLSPAKILILDEPCAGLDADTERKFLTTLNQTLGDRSSILIAHHLAGVEKLDRIYRLSAGRAVAAAG
ncbi:MAG: thiol reductant ABC exporter subunit CydC [Acetobacteraceae bacterium]|nr:thiol reductant ABC exporter subunit CydC [Acetobacteraceae bacterium]